MAPPRPRPSWAFNFTGRTRKIDKRPIKIEKQLTEIHDPRYSQRHVMALGQYLDGDQEPIMLKIRYDIEPEEDPDDSEPDDPKEVREAAEEDFLYEVHAVDIINNIGHGPKLLTYISQPQGSRLPYPKGWVDFIVMSRVPGEVLTDVYQGLSNEQLRGVQLQMAKILDHLRQVDCLLEDQDTDFFKYDEANDKLYLENFSFLDAFDPDENDIRPITVNSVWVKAFGIWRDDELEKSAKAPARQKNLIRKPQPAKTSEAPSPTAGGLSELPTQNILGTSTSPSKRRAPPGPLKEEHQHKGGELRKQASRHALGKSNDPLAAKSPFHSPKTGTLSRKGSQRRVGYLQRGEELGKSPLHSSFSRPSIGGGNPTHRPPPSSAAEHLSENKRPGASPGELRKQPSFAGSGRTQRPPQSPQRESHAKKEDERPEGHQPKSGGLRQRLSRITMTDSSATGSGGATQTPPHTPRTGNQSKKEKKREPWRH